METLITIVHVTVAIFMIIVVLVQGGNQGGVGAAFGGGNSQGVFGATGATSLLGKLTYAAALIFMVTTLSLTILQGQGGETGLGKRLQQAQEQKSTQSQPVQPEAAKAQETPSSPSTPSDKPSESP